MGEEDRASTWTGVRARDPRSSVVTGFVRGELAPSAVSWKVLLPKSSVSTAMGDPPPSAVSTTAFEPW